VVFREVHGKAFLVCLGVSKYSSETILYIFLITDITKRAKTNRKVLDQNKNTTLNETSTTSSRISPPGVSELSPKRRDHSPSPNQIKYGVLIFHFTFHCRRQMHETLYLIVKHRLKPLKKLHKVMF
jgi:hypothetical protein